MEGFERFENDSRFVLYIHREMTADEMKVFEEEVLCDSMAKAFLEDLKKTFLEIENEIKSEPGLALPPEKKQKLLEQTISAKAPKGFFGTFRWIRPEWMVASILFVFSSGALLQYWQKNKLEKQDAKSVQAVTSLPNEEAEQQTVQQADEQAFPPAINESALPKKKAEVASGLGEKKILADLAKEETDTLRKGSTGGNAFGEGSKVLSMDTAKEGFAIGSSNDSPDASSDGVVDTALSGAPLGRGGGLPGSAKPVATLGARLQESKAKKVVPSKNIVDDRKKILEDIGAILARDPDLQNPVDWNLYLTKILLFEIFMMDEYPKFYNFEEFAVPVLEGIWVVEAEHFKETKKESIFQLFRKNRRQFKKEELANAKWETDPLRRSIIAFFSCLMSPPIAVEGNLEFIKAEAKKSLLLNRSEGEEYLFRQEWNEFLNTVAWPKKR